MPSLRDDVRTAGWWLAVGIVVGGLVGGVVGGIGGRLVMLVLRLTSEADGLVSDDGFTIGTFSVSGSLQLYAGMALIGAVNGVAYVLARRFLPSRGRALLWGFVGAAAVGSLVVNTEGVDFSVLEPRWFAIAAFVCLPGLAALLIASLAERAASIEPWRVPHRFGLLAVPAVPALLGAPVFAVGAAVVVALSRAPALRRLPGRRAPRLTVLVLVLVVVLAGGVDLTRDALELL